MSHTQHKNLGIAIVLGMTMGLGPFAVDAYLPAFPSIADSLSVNVNEVARSISIYIFTLAIGQLIAGPVADRIGRERVMQAGLGIFALASGMIALADSLNSLLLLRALQAFGAGCTSVCIPAIVRDRMSGNEAARFFTKIGMIMIIAPAGAPAIGSLLLGSFGWRSIFIFLLVYSLLVLIPIKLVIFPRDYHERLTPPATSLWTQYSAVIKTQSALRFMLIQTLAFSIMLLFLTHASFIYQEHFKATPAQFSWLFAGNILVMFGVNLTNGKLLERFQAIEILRMSITLQALAIFLLLLVTAFYPSLWLFVPAMMITVGVLSAIIPNTMACYMDYFQDHGGTASALLGAFQFAVAGSLSVISTLLPEGLEMVILAQASCSAVCLLLVWNRKRPSYENNEGLSLE